jgi:hypothetical protein
MGILAFNTNTTGLVGQTVDPRRGSMTTTDNLATITTPGYLNNQNNAGSPIFPTDVFEVLYNFNINTKTFNFGIFTLTYSQATGFTLVQWANPGDVLLPVVSGDFANFNGTTGQISDAGFSPTNAAKTKVVMLNAAPTINHVAIFTAADGTIGDGGVLGTAAAKAATNAALADVASTAGSGFTIGHLITAADTAGSIQDSGIVATSLQASANIKANRTANIGGGGAGPISVVVAGVTAASIITGSIQASSNPSTIEKITATATGFDILFSADPGATCTVNYVAFVVAQ